MSDVTVYKDVFIDIDHNNVGIKVVVIIVYKAQGIVIKERKSSTTLIVFICVYVCVFVCVCVCVDVGNNGIPGNGNMQLQIWKSIGFIKQTTLNVAFSELEYWLTITDMNLRFVC